MEVVHKNAGKSGVSKVFGAITIDSVGPNQFNDKKMTAQIRQIVTSVYPGVRGSNSLQDALFGDDQFGGEPQEFNEVRVAFVDVPLGSSLKTVTAQLKKFPEARIYRILSLKPVLTNEQKRAIETGISSLTMEDYEKRVALDKNEKPLDYKGRNFYRATFFSTSPVEDIDLRDEELTAELGADLQLGANAPARTTAKA